MSTRILGALGLVLAMATSLCAGPVTLQAQALLERPAVIVVDPKNVTTIQFCDQIIWSAFKASWLHATVGAQDKRVLLLDASANSGEASMHVWVEGEGAPLQFSIRVSGTTLANHLYFVSCTHAPPASATSPALDVTARPTASSVSIDGGTPTSPGVSPSAGLSAVKGWDEFVAGLSSQQRSLLDGLIAHPSADMHLAFVRSLTSDQAAKWATLAPAARLVAAGAPTIGTGSGRQGLVTTGSPGLPTWAVWQMSTTTTLAGRVVSYNLTNTGNKTLVLDAARLRVVGANGTPISGVSLSRRSTSGFEGRVPPGQAESGVIWIPTTPTGEVNLRWPIVEIGTEVVYTINQRIL
jgi:hypothetical protein